MSCKNKTQIPTPQTKSYIGYYKLSYREFGTAIPNKEKRPFFSLQRGTASSFSKHTHQSLFKRACLASLRLPFKATLSLSFSQVKRRRCNGGVSDSERYVQARFHRSR